MLRTSWNFFFAEVNHLDHSSESGNWRVRNIWSKSHANLDQNKLCFTDFVDSDGLEGHRQLGNDNSTFHLNRLLPSWVAFASVFPQLSCFKKIFVLSTRKQQQWGEVRSDEAEVIFEVAVGRLRRRRDAGSVEPGRTAAAPEPDSSGGSSGHPTMQHELRPKVHQNTPSKIYSVINFFTPDKSPLKPWHHDPIWL